MPDFMINEGVFVFPSGWEDRSVTAVTFPVGDPTPSATITVTRESSRDPKQTLGSYVSLQLATLAKTCGGFQLIRHIPTQLSGVTAVLAEVTWTTPEKLEVRQVIVTTFIQPQYVVITATATADRFSEFENVFYSIINSFRAKRPHG
jgi:hypothetical protein